MFRLSNVIKKREKNYIPLFFVLTYLLNSFLDRIQEEEGTSNVQNDGDQTIEELSNLFIEIENFEHNHPRIAIHKNLLDFFESKKYKLPALFELAMTVLGVPATQVSVERAFSSLNFILSDKRYNLSPKTLESLLLVRLNK